jgi:hypothetical protein
MIGPEEQIAAISAFQFSVIWPTTSKRAASDSRAGPSHRGTTTASRDPALVLSSSKAESYNVFVE